MKRLLKYMTLLLAVTSLSFCTDIHKSNVVVLTENVESKYSIVIPSVNTRKYSFAAGEMQDFIEKISGTKLPIVVDKRNSPKHLRRVQEAHLSVLYASLYLEYGTLEEQQEMLEGFYKGCKRNGIIKLHEVRNYLHQFYDKDKERLDKM